MYNSTYSYPPEIIYEICAAVYRAAVPATISSLDPLYCQHSGDVAAQTSSPSTYPPSCWPEPLARKTLDNLCLVSKAWNEGARPWLFHRVEVRLPRSWLALVDEICGPDEDESEYGQANPPVETDQNFFTLPTSSHSSNLREDFFSEDEFLPFGTIPVDLLSPPASRDPSPARLRAKSPGRWNFLRAINEAVASEPGFYVPTPKDPRPGRHVRHLDFNHFRTIGMRRSVGEGVRSRFVTDDRVERVLKEMPNLLAFGATEFMDSAITTEVLSELVLRGLSSPHSGGQRGRGTHVGGNTTDTDEDEERRADCKPLQAIDFCGCVSGVFVKAMNEFADRHLAIPLPPAEYDDDEVPPPPPRSGKVFPGLRRLGLRGVTSVPSDVLQAFVLSFTSLTHLDLSGTRCSPELLVALGASSTIRLEALAISKCPRLTSDSITSFLIQGASTQNITHLSLFGDATFPSPLTAENLSQIIEAAPCFQSGQLEYLDLSSNRLTPSILSSFPPQPSLRSLGLSYIPTLPIRSISDFLLERAPNVEVVTLALTSPELCSSTIAARDVSLALHSKLIRPLCTPPFQFSLSTTPVAALPPPTRLRVIELALPTLASLGGGAGSWKIVRSKGGRAWYVDSASAWADGVLRRDLSLDHPIRVEVGRLSACNGNVGSGVGWHAHKMEVLHGQGLLGREDGLYGAVSFAYKG